MSANILVGYGLPFSGKTTHLENYAREHELAFLDVGKIFRDEKKRDSDIARIIVPFMDKGRLVPTCHVHSVMYPLLDAESSKKRDFVVVGLPRTVKQGEKLKRYLRQKEYSLIACHFDISEEESLDRFSDGRDGGSDRPDDLDLQKFKKRLSEFKRAKGTLSLLRESADTYIRISGNGRQKAEVYRELAERLTVARGRRISRDFEGNIPSAEFGAPIVLSARAAHVATPFGMVLSGR